MKNTKNNIDSTTLVLTFIDVIRKDVQDKLPESCSFMHVKALDFIGKAIEPSMRDVASHLNITSPGATMIIDKLVELGEIDRHDDKDDRRVVRLKITSKGINTLESGLKVIKEKIRNRMKVLTIAENKSLGNILNKIIDN
jgi:DNA-binding MarR family transcriptional regulator